MAANGGSVAIAVDGASSVELGSGQTDMLPALNAMCAPSQLGDPITALNIDEDHAFLVVGTATGRVSAYPIAHIIEPPPNKHADSEKFAAIQELHAFTARNHFVAVTLGKASDEGIRSIFFLDDDICATIGDLHVKIWQGYDQPSYQLIKYKRMHHSTACAQTFTLQAGPHVFMLTQESSEAFMVDLNTGVQKSYCMPLGRRAVPTSYDGDRVVILSNTTVPPVADSSEAPIRTGQEISVYQLLPGQPKMLTKITMADAHQHYWGFVLCDNMLAYVSNQTVIKVYGIEELLSASSPGGEAHHHLGQQHHDVLFRMDTGSRVLSFHTAMRADRLHVWAICADRGVRHFKQGQLMRTWPNVLGEIGALGYPLVCRVRGDYLFYAADDGVYYLNVFSDALTPE